MKDREALPQSEAEVDRLAKALLSEHDRRAAFRLAERFVGHAVSDRDLQRELLWRRVVEALESDSAGGRV